MDETGCDEFYCPDFVYSKIGKPVVGKVSGRRYARTNIVAGYTKTKDGWEVIAEKIYKQRTKSVLFEEWFEKKLLPKISKKSVIVLDNATFHRKKTLRKLARKRNCRVIFLPPYSPDLNPIEKKWANLKKWLRANVHKFDSLFFALLSYFKTT